MTFCRLFLSKVITMADSKTVEAERKETKDAPVVVKEKQYYTQSPIPQGSMMVHASIHKDIAPHGAVRMTDEEVETMAWKVIYDWRPRKEM